MKRLLLYGRTVSHLKLRQIGYYLLRRVLPAPRFDGAERLLVQQRPGVAMQVPLVGAMALGGDCEFCFLNAAKRFERGRVDWASAEMPKLWRYNLHYFDYILDTGRPAENACGLIADWIRNNPTGTGDGWEPYTVSLRIANWIKLFLRQDFAGRVQPAWLDSLHRQAAWLERNIEYHILANHYLKNGKALFFAGMFFDGPDAQRWLHKGLKILVEEAHEQILADGGHYERSPMYHCIVVEDYLDALNLALSNPSLVGADVVDLFKAKAGLALDFLHGICLPDGGIPLFNDAAFGIAPTAEALVGYARRVGVETSGGLRLAPNPPYDWGKLVGRNSAAYCAERVLHLSAFEATGYYVIRSADDMLIVDCGRVGPDYQPGHAHCDTLSYELALEGRRVIVDSGVHDYEAGELRRYVRGTRAHNTVTVDGEEQSEVWGAFRVARRARPLGASLERLPDGGARFSGSHDGYTRLPGRPIHRREITYRPDDTWTVTDTVTGAGMHSVESYIHLHPDIAVQVNGNRVILARESRPVAEIEVLHGAQLAVEEGWYCPQFGLARRNVVLKLSLSDMLPIELAYRIEKRRR